MQRQTHKEDDIGSTGEPVKSINDRWKNRRRLAYMSFASIVFMVIYAMIDPKTVSDVGTVVNTFLAGMFGVLLAYTGTATWDDVTARRDNPQNHYDRPRDRGRRRRDRDWEGPDFSQRPEGDGEVDPGDVKG